MNTASPNLTTAPLRQGDKLDKYTLIEQIGAGGFSIVFKAHDPLLDQFVAVKQILPDPTIEADAFRERFRREAAIQKKVGQRHKHLVRIIDFVEEPRGFFIVMEYVDGPSLEHLLAQNPGPVDPATALGIAAASAVALGTLHEQGIIHRDLKPANILLPKAGGLKICDFGLATLMADQETPATGTVRYMAPELLNEQPADGRADIYSLGVVLYEMLIGRSNFEDSFKIVLRDQRNQALRWMKWHTNLKVKATPIKSYVPALPEGIGQLIDRMMEKDPGQRIANTGQLLDAMRRQLQGGAAAATPPVPGAPGSRATAAPGPAGDKTQKIAKSNTKLYIAAATLGFWLLVGVGYLFYTSSQENKAREAHVQLVFGGYRDAIKLFLDQKYADAEPLFTQLEEEYPGDLDLPVTVAGNKKKPLRDSIDGHRLFCQARALLDKGHYDEALVKLREMEKLDVVGRDLYIRTEEEAIETRAIVSREQEVKDLLKVSNFQLAEKLCNDFLRDYAKRLTEDQHKRWLELRQQVDGQRDFAAAQQILTQAKELEKRDRRGALALVEAWIEENRHRTNVLVESYRDSLKAGLTYEDAVARGRSAQQRLEHVPAIDAYESALKINRPKGEADGLPAIIRKLYGRIAFEAGKAAFDAGNMTAAVTELNKALGEDPTLAEAKNILKQIDSASQRADLQKQAVIAFESKEYEKSINLWQRLRDDFGEDPAKVSAEVLKAQKLIAADELEKAWAGGEDDPTLKAIDKMHSLDPENARATLLKSLITTRNDFRAKLANADKAFERGEYGEGKGHVIAAEKIAAKISDASIKEGLLAQAKAKKSEIEYVDALTKAKLNFDQGRLNEAFGWAKAAVKEKKTPEAEAVLAKIEAEIGKQSGKKP